MLRHSPITRRPARSMLTFIRCSRRSSRRLPVPQMSRSWRSTTSRPNRCVSARSRRRMDARLSSRHASPSKRLWRGAVAPGGARPRPRDTLKEAGIEFDGYPSFVARCTGTPVDDAYLMLCFDSTRIVHTTLHVSLRHALDLITEARVLSVITATHAVLARHGKPVRIAVAGLNPHASESGMFGDDEARIIEPALKAARERGIDVDGPFGADTMFKKSGYDAFIVMYHDQGHIAAKLLATNRTAGMTIGTPVLFSSVAHGSALDIAGQNRASPEAVVEAVLRLSGTATMKAAA